MAPTSVGSSVGVHFIMETSKPLARLVSRPGHHLTAGKAQAREALRPGLLTALAHSSLDVSPLTVFP